MKHTYKRLLLSSLFCSLLAAPFAARAEIPAADFEKAMAKYVESDANMEILAKSLQTFFEKKQRDQQAQQAQAEQKKLEDQIKNPVKIDVTGAPAKGPDNAEITVVEFSDFQCPYCQRGAQTMDELYKAYPGKIKIVFKNMPLPFHAQAKPAAQAALAAGKQGKFWEMHDLLFKNQDGLTEANFNKWAAELGLNVDKFKADFNDPATAKQVEADMAMGNKLGVEGTPGFFVNGVAVRGARPVEYFKMLIERIQGKK